VAEVISESRFPTDTSKRSVLRRSRLSISLAEMDYFLSGSATPASHAQTPAGFAELVSDYFPILHYDADQGKKVGEINGLSIC
jgi:hypothetical protein